MGNTHLIREHAFDNVYIFDDISLIPDSLFRAIYIKETSKLLQIDEATLYQEISTLFIHKKTDASTYVKTQTIHPTTVPVPSHVEDFYMNVKENTEVFSFCDEF